MRINQKVRLTKKARRKYGRSLNDNVFRVDALYDNYPDSVLCRTLDNKKEKYLMLKEWLIPMS